MSEPKMLTALHPFKIKEVTPKEFISEFGVNYQEKDIFPSCLYCGEKVFTYGTSSTQVISRFKHFNGMSCQAIILGGFGNEHPGFNFSNIEKIKNEFYDQKIISKSYALCLDIIGKGNFPVSKFLELCKKADKKHIWAYVGIEVWMIPYILLTLNDFTIISRDGNNTYNIRFVLDKHFNVNTLDKKCNIEKIFTDSQKILKSYPVSESDFYATDESWIKDKLLDKLLSFAKEEISTH
jgi:hypothetical protein